METFQFQYWLSGGTTAMTGYIKGSTKFHVIDRLWEFVDCQFMGIVGFGSVEPAKEIPGNVRIFE